eukprot:1169552-Pleurochrysis_carterae.AAC.3
MRACTSQAGRSDTGREGRIPAPAAEFKPYVWYAVAPASSLARSARRAGGGGGQARLHCDLRVRDGVDDPEHDLQLCERARTAAYAPLRHVGLAKVEHQLAVVHLGRAHARRVHAHRHAPALHHKEPAKG